VEVIHENGCREVVYGETHLPGDDIFCVVTTHGRPGMSRIRVFLNDKLIKDAPV